MKTLDQDEINKWVQTLLMIPRSHVFSVNNKVTAEKVCNCLKGFHYTYNYLESDTPLARRNQMIELINVQQPLVANRKIIATGIRFPEDAVFLDIADNGIVITDSRHTLQQLEFHRL